VRNAVAARPFRASWVLMNYSNTVRSSRRRGADNLTKHAWARLLAGIEAGDDHVQVAAAWAAAHHLRAIYRCRDRDQAAAGLYDWTIACIDSG
jgi:hypothetical protein